MNSCRDQHRLMKLAGLLKEDVNPYEDPADIDYINKRFDIQDYEVPEISIMTFVLQDEDENDYKMDYDTKTLKIVGADMWDTDGEEGSMEAKDIQQLNQNETLLKQMHRIVYKNKYYTMNEDVNPYEDAPRFVYTHLKFYNKSTNKEVNSEEEFNAIENPSEECEFKYGFSWSSENPFDSVTTEDFTSTEGYIEAFVGPEIVASFGEGYVFMKSWWNRLSSFRFGMFMLPGYPDFDTYLEDKFSGGDELTKLANAKFLATVNFNKEGDIISKEQLQSKISGLALNEDVNPYEDKDITQYDELIKDSIRFGIRVRQEDDEFDDEFVEDLAYQNIEMIASMGEPDTMEYEDLINSFSYDEIMNRIDQLMDELINEDVNPYEDPTPLSQVKFIIYDGPDEWDPRRDDTWDIAITDPDEDRWIIIGAPDRGGEFLIHKADTEKDHPQLRAATSDEVDALNNNKQLIKDLTDSFNKYQDWLGDKYEPRYESIKEDINPYEDQPLKENESIIVQYRVRYERFLSDNGDYQRRGVVEVEYFDKLSGPADLEADATYSGLKDDIEQQDGNPDDHLYKDVEEEDYIDVTDNSYSNGSMHFVHIGNGYEFAEDLVKLFNEKGQNGVKWEDVRQYLL